MKPHPTIITQSANTIVAGFIATFIALFPCGHNTAVAGQPSVERVTGGGFTYREQSGSQITQWTSVTVQKDDGGAVSGMIEYANLGIQDWRYQLEPECLYVTEDGRRAVIIGAVVNSQGPDAPALGTRVVFLIGDYGNGKGADVLAVFFAWNYPSCDWRRWQYLFRYADPVVGNFSIQRR